MFSATMPSEIQGLAGVVLKNPIDVRIPSESVEADTVEQVVYFIDTHSKLALLEHLLQGKEITRALVFTRTKHGADRVAERLSRAGIRAEAMHSNKSQNQRLHTLANFKRGTTRVLVASDIAARGLDVDNISHVINYDMPNEAGVYVHRIGRTGRAGALGQAISFCSPDQRGELADIERLLGKRIRLVPHSIKSHLPAEVPGPAPGPFSGWARRRAEASDAKRRQARSGPAPAGHPPVHGHGRGPAQAPKAKPPERQSSQSWTHKRRPPGAGSGRPRPPRRRA